MKKALLIFSSLIIVYCLFNRDSDDGFNTLLGGFLLIIIMAGIGFYLWNKN